MQLRTWWHILRMLECPLQNAMNDEVWVTPDGRGEMRVLIEAEREMAQRLGGVAGLFEGTQHKVGDDTLFRFADNLFDQALIVLRRDAQVAAWERYLHTALAAVAVGVGTAGFRGSGNAAMANGDFALVQVFDSERVAESAGQFFELEDFTGVGLFMNAMERFNAAAKKICGDRAIGGEHELFDETVSDIALAARDIGHALLFVEFDDRLGEIEIDGATFVAAGVEEQSKLLHIAEARRERRVTLRHFRVGFEDFVDVGIGHALDGANDAGSHARGFHVAGGVEFHERAHHEAIFAGLKRTHTIRKGFGKHGDGAIGEVNGSAAQTRFLVERRASSNIVRHVGDVDLQVPTAVSAMLNVNGVVEIARAFAVDGDDGQVAEIFTAGALGLADGLRATLGFVKNVGGEDMREMVLANDDLGVDAEFTRTAENFDDAASRRCASVWIAEQLDVDDGAVEFVEARDAPGSNAGFIRAAEAELFPEARRQFVPARDFNFVLDANVVRKDDVCAGTIAKQTDDGRVSTVEDPQNAAFRALSAGDAAQTLNLCENVVAVHGVLDGVGRNEDVAVELGYGRIGHDEAVTVVVKDQATFDFIATREGGRLGMTSRVLLERFLAGRLAFRLTAREAVSSSG